MKSRFRLLPAGAGLLALLLLVACASTPEGAQRGNPNVITQDELLALQATQSLHEAVERLRPRWLTARGGAQTFGEGAGGSMGVVVYQGQTYLGGPEALRQLTVDMATSLRFMDGPSASASLPGLGSRAVAGAIIVEPRSTPRRSPPGR